MQVNVINIQIMWSYFIYKILLFLFLNSFIEVRDIKYTNVHVQFDSCDLHMCVTIKIVNTAIHQKPG